MKLRTPHNERRSLYLPPPGLLLMQVRVPDRSVCSKRRNLYDKNHGVSLKRLKINILYRYSLSGEYEVGAPFLCGACGENGGAERTERPFTFFLFLKARMERCAISQRPRIIQATRAGVLSVISHKNRMTSSADSKKIPMKRQYSDSPLCLARGEKSARRDGISSRSTRKSSMVFVMINRENKYMILFCLFYLFSIRQSKAATCYTFVSCRLSDFPPSCCYEKRSIYLSEFLYSGNGYLKQAIVNNTSLIGAFIDIVFSNNPHIKYL